MFCSSSTWPKLVIRSRISTWAPVAPRATSSKGAVAKPSLTSPEIRPAVLPLFFASTSTAMFARTSVSMAIFICSEASSAHMLSRFKSAWTSITSSRIVLKYLPLSICNSTIELVGRSTVRFLPDVWSLMVIVGLVRILTVSPWFLISSLLPQGSLPLTSYAFT